MTYDLKITNGSIIDGSGRERFAGDIGIRDGKIIDVGTCNGNARHTINADGAVVTPGFTDIHTHYDGQASWDGPLAPSSLHGVTTCVLGNCGVGFAPVRKTDHERLIQLMEGVEDIPGTALSEGLTWKWETFPEYMQALDNLPHSIDFCAQVPHDALRVYVMGERALAEEVANEDDIKAMRDHVRQALEAGALGFSTGRTDNHRTSLGQPTPASEAASRELAGIAEAFHGLNHGVLQAVSDFDMGRGPEPFDAEFDVLLAMVKNSGGHPLSISTMQRDQAPGQWQRIIERAEQANREGINIRLQVAARAIGVMLGLNATFHPFMGFPSYKRISQLPLAERVARMRDPEFKRQLLTEKSEPVSGDGSAIPPLADLLLAQIDMLAMRMYNLGEQPNYEPSPETCIYQKAQLAGCTVLEAIYDELLADDGSALIYFPLYNYGKLNLDDVHQMLTHPLALPGLSDGGAHVGTICDASFPTFLLTHWGRDRKKGRIPLEKLVKMQAFDTARYIGLTDRGSIAPGQRADINIIDHKNLRLGAPAMHADLPAGGKRLLQDAHGYVATLVNGEVIALNGRLTDARPGRLVRLGRS